MSTGKTLRLALVIAAAGLATGAFVFAPAACAKTPDEDAEAAAKTDTIVFEEGGERRTRSGVTVESADHDEVKFKDGGRSSSMAGTKVVDIEWGDAPREYLPAWRAIAQHDGAGAQRNFKACLNAKDAGFVERDWVDEFVNAGLGEAYVLLATSDATNYDKATAAFEAAKKANPKSILLNRIHRGLAEAALGKGKNEDALRHADDLLKAGRAARRPAWELDAQFLRAEVHNAADNANGAKQAYEDAARLAEQQSNAAKDASTKARFEALRRSAAAAGGWVLVEKGLASSSAADLQAATAYFSSLPSKFGEEAEILSAVENANGVIKFAGKDYYGALRHLQTAEVLYFNVPSEVARSLYYQAECWGKLGDQQKRGVCVRDLKEYYPKSEWARKLK